MNSGECLSALMKKKKSKTDVASIDILQWYIL